MEWLKKPHCARPAIRVRPKSGQNSLPRIKKVNDKIWGNACKHGTCYARSANVINVLLWMLLLLFLLASAFFLTSNAFRSFSHLLYLYGHLVWRLICFHAIVVAVLVCSVTSRIKKMVVKRLFRAYSPTLYFFCIHNHRDCSHAGLNTFFFITVACIWGEPFVSRTASLCQRTAVFLICARACLCVRNTIFARL